MSSGPSSLHTLVAGSISGSLSVLVCHPMDVIRTRIQTSPPGTSWMDSLKVSIKNEGVGVLYRGLVGPFYAQALYKSIIFTSNTIFGKLIPGQADFKKTFITGTLSGMTNAIVVSPIELIRTSQIVYKEPFFQCLKLVYRNQGLFAFWKSLFPTIMRDGPGIGFYLFGFDFAKKKLPSDVFTPLQTKLVAGSFAGIAFWCWALPLDTIKTTIEAERNAQGKPASSLTLFFRTTSRILGGSDPNYPGNFAARLKGLYRPWLLAISRGIPAAAVTLTTYDYVIEYLSKK